MAVTQTKNEIFEEGVIRYKERLYKIALSMTGDEVNAQDLVQKTWLRAYRFFDKFRQGTDYEAWLINMMKNLYINIYKKEQRAPKMVDFEVALDIKPSGLTPEQEFFDPLFDDDIKVALDELSKKFYNVILLSDVEGLSYKEIATELDCPVGTVMSRLHRARKLLKKRLTGYAKNHGYIK